MDKEQQKYSHFPTAAAATLLLRFHDCTVYWACCLAAGGIMHHGCRKSIVYHASRMSEVHHVSCIMHHALHASWSMQ
jgi:hypothetical protein